jgi:hypothetical protein
MQELSELIKKRLNQHKLGTSSQASEVIFKANQYLKGWLSSTPAEVNATVLKNGVLWVEVGHSSWGQEVWGISSLLLKRLQEEYGESMIHKICTKGLTTL